MIKYDMAYIYIYMEVRILICIKNIYESFIKSKFNVFLEQSAN